LHDLALAPSYFNATMSVYLAFDLYPQTLAGDEPEPLQVISWPIGQYQQLLAKPDFTEARSIAALFLTKEYLEANQ
jgi:ADP-ribose diphosphatase